jgi:hypothetical protein
MIARINLILPFALTIPENEVYNIYTYHYKDYTIKYYPPIKKSDKANSYSNSQAVTINSLKTFNADVFQIDFIKSEFDRRQGSEFDPKQEDISEVVNDLLARMRYVLSASQIRALNFQRLDLQLDYLNDDGTELKKKEGFVRGRGTKNFLFNCIALTKEVWESVHSLEPFKDLPIWKILLLDAQSVLPQIGPAVVLTFTALEVFISKTLDAIAKYNKLDEKLWAWINDRGFFLKEPSIDEQYDFLCKHLIGVTIKEDQKLWVPFKNLQKARNSFAHTGVCKLDGKEINDQEVLEFIIKANEIISVIKNKLPEELHWPEFQHTIYLEGVIPII